MQVKLLLMYVKGKLDENFKKFYDLKFQKNTKFKIKNQ